MDRPLMEKERSVLRDAAKEAAATWVVGLVEHAGILVTETVGEGGSPVLVFRAEWSLVDGEEREELRSVDVACGSGRTRLSPSSGDREAWHESVTLWGELRDAMGSLYATEIPASLVVDVAEQNVAGYEPHHCRSCGPVPEIVGHVTRSETSLDPFAELLGGDEAEIDRIVTRIEALLEQYGYEPPTSPDEYSCDDE